MRLSDIQILFGDIAKAIETNCFDNDLEALGQAVAAARHYNKWFTPDAVTVRLSDMCQFVLSTSFERYWQQSENIPIHRKTFGFISNENIPLEDFFTLLALLISGNCIVYKVTQHSDNIIKSMVALIVARNSVTANQMELSERYLKGHDYIMYTSIGAPSALKESYLSKSKLVVDVRHQSAAIIAGHETDTELTVLLEGVFKYYQQSASSIRKVFLPRQYPLARLFEAMELHHTMLNHNAYANNYQYHQSVYLMNRIPHLDNGFLLLKEDTGNRAPTGVLYYEFYTDISEVSDIQYHTNAFYKIYTAVAYHNLESEIADSNSHLILPKFNLFELA